MSKFQEFYKSTRKFLAGVVGAVGKISAFRPQGSQFDPGPAEIWTDLGDFLSRLS